MRPPHKRGPRPGGIGRDPQKLIALANREFSAREVFAWVDRRAETKRAAAVAQKIKRRAGRVIHDKNYSAKRRARLKAAKSAEHASA